MKEIISTVVIDKHDQDIELQIIYEDGVLDFVIEGQALFGGDWGSNFSFVFQRALEMWQ